MLETAIGITAATMTTCGFGYQLFKMIKTKKTKDTTYQLIVLTGASFVLWTLFGLYLDNSIIYGTNVLMAVILVATFYYKIKKEKFQNSSLIPKRSQLP